MTVIRRTTAHVGWGLQARIVYGIYVGDPLSLSGVRRAETREWSYFGVGDASAPPCPGSESLEVRGLRNIVETTDEGDYMPKYLPPMYDDA